jgi:catechol 2,3-dioxygenase-like lactoylglutathione lyase family enzyme
MTFPRMDNVEIVVDDLKAAIAFFVALGMELEGETSVQGDSVDRILDLAGVHTNIAMMRTPDGHSRLELAKFHTPQAVTAGAQNAPPNAFGIRRIMFAVEDIEATLACLKPHGGEVLGEIVQFENSYRLCYLRGPEGIMLALAQALS